MPGRREFQPGDRVRMDKCLGTVTGAVKMSAGNTPAAIVEFDGAKSWYTIAAAALERMPKDGFKLLIEVGAVECYVDYKYEPPGFGEDGNDRTEQITLALHQNGKNSRSHWYAVADHRDPNGNDWYQNDKDELPSREAAVQWLKEDRAKAPKTKEEASGEDKA